MLVLDREALATALGYASIGCWLCAQLPQVIKNIQLSSCDGLSFPFLVTWLFGDFTNLIGCILTDQLPFQTYLATYFCLVDVTLVGQFFYYSKTEPATPLSAAKPHPSPRSSLILPAPATRSRGDTVPASPRPNTRALTRPTSGRGRSRRLPPSTSHTNIITESPVYAPPADSVDALYAAALDVARAAERITLRRSNSGRPRARHGATMPAGGSSDALVDSFHSDLSLPSALTTDDEDDHSRHRMTQSTSALTRRGRSLARFDHPTGTPPPVETEDVVDDLPDSHMVEFRRHPNRSHSRSQSAARQRGSGRRAATVAFMSLGMLFWRSSGSIQPMGSGHVVAPTSGLSVVPVTMANATWPYPVHPAHFPFRPSSFVMVDAGNGTDPGEPKPPPEREQVSWQEAIGRVSAWCCTTLYLSSRLPQIWKNFQRKSVEGLSILLFLFAFLGNVLYVLSIVLAPVDSGETAHYLLRALPYLLGSGGTLLFDMTIMIQSWMYGSAPPIQPRTPLDRPRRALSYGAIGRRRTRHTEDGMHGSISERRPLLASPARAATEPYPHPESRNSVSEAGSSGVYGHRTSDEENHRTMGLGIQIDGGIPDKGDE